MKTIGLLLVMLAFLAGAFISSLDPAQVRWDWMLPVLAAGVAGLWMHRTARHAESRADHKLSGNMDTLEALAGDDRETARAAADRLGSIAEEFPGRWLEACASLARARVALAEGEVDDAVADSRGAVAAWADVGAHCAGTPVAALVPGPDEPPPDSPPLSRRAELNVSLLLFVAQAIKIVLVATVITLFYLLFRDFRAHRTPVREALRTLFSYSVTTTIVNGRVLARGDWPGIHDIIEALEEDPARPEEVVGGVA